MTGSLWILCQSTKTRSMTLSSESTEGYRVVVAINPRSRFQKFDCSFRLRISLTISSNDFGSRCLFMFSNKILISWFDLRYSCIAVKLSKNIHVRVCRKLYVHVQYFKASISWEYQHNTLCLSISRSVQCQPLRIKGWNRALFMGIFRRKFWERHISLWGGG